MFRRLRRIVGGKGRVLLVAAAATLGLAPVAAELLRVRLGGDATQTRIVIDLNHAATGKVISDGADDRRVVVVLQGASTEGAQGAGSGLVKAWVADQAAGGLRLRIDLSA